MKRIARSLPMLLCFAAISASAQESGAAKSEELPFELKVILTDHEKRLDDGITRLSKMTIEKLSKLKADYLKAGRTDDAEKEIFDGTMSELRKEKPEDDKN